MTQMRILVQVLFGMHRQAMQNYPSAQSTSFGEYELMHRINGESVFILNDMQLDEDDVDARRLLEAGASLQLSEGYIAIQAESHPTQFRKIQIKPLN